MISVTEASERILAEVPRGGVETVPIAQAGGRILRLGVSAERAFPPFDRVMMDGVAIARAAWERGERRFRVVGSAPAGAPRQILATESDALEVMTGAILPEGAGVIVPVERLRRSGEVVTVESGFSPPDGGYIHRAGSDARAGMELLRPGTRLDGRALAVAVSCGATEVTVSRRPRIAIVSTGDELVDIGHPLAPHQIRRSNAYALQATLHGHGYGDADLCHFADEPDLLSAGLEEALAAHDFVILSGGVSAGPRDHVSDALTGLGARIVFHQVAQRPGKPMLFALRERTSVFGLPGNPVSTLVGLCRHVFTALDAWTAITPREPLTVKLSTPVSFSPPLTYFLPVIRSGPGLVTPRPVSNSGDFAALLETDGFIELPADRDCFEAGFAAPLFAW